MARTRGAKDKTKRRQPAKHQSSLAHQRPVKAPPAAGKDAAPPADRPAIPPDEFQAAIAAELGSAGVTSDASHGAGQDPAQPGSPPAQPPPFDPGALTIDGLASAWQLPFYALGKLLHVLRVTPDPEPIYDVGRRRAKDLAKPSYAIYEYCCREYLRLNPDNTVHVAAGATGLNAIGILPDLIDAIARARAKAAAAQQPMNIPGATRQPGQCPEPSIN
jgi:hypothetical protein